MCYFTCKMVYSTVVEASPSRKAAPKRVPQGVLAAGSIRPSRGESVPVGPRDGVFGVAECRLEEDLVKAISCARHSVICF